MEKHFYYLDMNVPRYFSEIDSAWWNHCLRKRLCCPPGCGGVPQAREGEPVIVQYTKAPTYSLEPGAMARVLSVSLWSALQPHLPSAIVGRCELRTNDTDKEPIPNCLSVYLPVRDRVCIRGISNYSICPACGTVRCKDVSAPEYILEHEVREKRAAMLTEGGFIVDSGLRDEIFSYNIKCLEFFTYKIRSTPLDGRPANLNDWPELNKFRTK